MVRLLSSCPLRRWPRLLLVALLAVSAPLVHATTLGPVVPQSYLGQPFNALIQVAGVSRNVMIAGCFKAKIESANGKLLSVPRIDVSQFDPDGSTGQIAITSREAISEPVVRLSVALACEDAVLRVYPMMMDYPERAGPLPQIAPPTAANEPVREFLTPPDKIVPSNAVGDDAPKSEPGEAAKKAAAQRAANKDLPPVLAPALRDEIEREAEHARLKEQEQKVAGLESELTRLKMDYQIQSAKDQDVLKAQREQKEKETPPVLLIILDLIVIMLLVAAIACAAYFIGKRPRASMQ